MSQSPDNRHPSPRILYCRCAYANVVPEETKDGVLEKLCAAGAAFDSVSDLCEMSARRDPALSSIAQQGDVKIAACYERAVKGLFRAADAPLSDGVQVLNMRTEDADRVVDGLLNANLRSPSAERPEEEAAADAPAPKPDPPSTPADEPHAPAGDGPASDHHASHAGKERRRESA